MLDVKRIRINDCVMVEKKVVKPSTPNVNWYSSWQPAMDRMVGKICRVVEISWWPDNGRDGSVFYSGNGVTLQDPHSPIESPQCFGFLPESIKEDYIRTMPSMIYDAEGFAKCYTSSGFHLEHKDGYSLKLNYNPFCCGTMELGSFNIRNDATGRKLVSMALNQAVTNRKGVVQCTTNGSQHLISNLLESLNFKLKSSFRNPNSGNIVYEYEHRTFNGEVDVPVPVITPATVGPTATVEF